MNYQEKLEEILNNLPKRPKKLLIHACCAPCSSYVIEYLSNYFNITIYYYNPNIEPVEEYDKRASEITKFVSEFKTKNPVKCIIESYDNSEYENAIKGYETEEEGAKRCFICYRLRMEKAARYAKKHKFSYFTTTLSISPYKNSNKLNEVGEDLEKEFGVKYLYADFKKKNGYKRSIELSKEYNLYRQDYCGCKYSKLARDRREEAKLLRAKEEQKKNNKVKFLFNNFYNKEISKKIRKDKDPNMFKFHDIRKRDLNKISIFRIFEFLFKIILAFTIVIIGIYLICKNNFVRDVTNEEFELQIGNNPSAQIKVINKKKEKDKKIPTEENKALLNEIYIYGNRLNMKGEFECEYKNVTDVNLVFVGNTNNIEYNLNYTLNNNTINYYIADKLNTGFALDNIMVDKYIMFIKIVSDGETFYYSIDNKTNYENTIYYTISDKNDNVKKLTFSNENKYNSIELKVEKTSDEVYDIVLDPGHGGSDKGACYNSKCEIDYTLELANMLKEDLEEKGLKVALTRYDNSTLDKYNSDGRVDRSYESNAKFLLSIHLNASGTLYNGFELYTSNYIDYTFARNLVQNLDGVNEFTFSPNKFSRVESGIYTRTFSDTDIHNINKDSKEKNYTPFKVSKNTNYYFMIRETGGYMTGAYIDGRDGEGINSYVLSNRGIESYILELGYISSKTDLNYVDKYKEDYIQAISNSIADYLNK